MDPGPELNRQFRMILISKYNLELKKEIQPEVESYKLQASSDAT